MPDLTGAERGFGTKLRATQTLVSHMAFCWSHPSLVLIEIAWRWLFGIPFLYVLWVQAQQILAQIPPASVGLDRLETQNPWLSSVLLAEAISRYEPSVVAMMHWLVPAGVAGWAIVSGIGRMLVLMRMSTLDPIDPIPGRSRFRFLPSLPHYMALQALWMVALLTCFSCWFHAVGWASARYITAVSPPNLEVYLCWLIFISLGIYTAWAMLSWVLAVAPLLMILEGDLRPAAAVRALGRSFSLGKALSGKLMEVGLVLAIVKIMLIVLDMVLSAAPLPFADEFGPSALHVLYVLVAILFLMANDYFHVVRLRSYIALWRHYRHQVSYEKSI